MLPGLNKGLNKYIFGLKKYYRNCSWFAIDFTNEYRTPFQLIDSCCPVSTWFLNPVLTLIKNDIGEKEILLKSPALILSAAINPGRHWPILWPEIMKGNRGQRLFSVFFHLLPKLRTYYLVRLIDGADGIFPTSYAGASNWNHARSVQDALLTELPWPRLCHVRNPRTQSYYEISA